MHFLFLSSCPSSNRDVDIDKLDALEGQNIIAHFKRASLIELAIVIKHAALELTN